uniref:Neur_chan_LBD domain-containing protein n=1 Tax=Ascaris lumbricoides TaxID=6252 RepID=A0A0M3IWM5_ASCLU
MACQPQITSLGLVTNVSGTKATVWIFPTNYDREPEIEVDFKQRRLPLALGNWIHLKKDEYGRLRYKIMDENDCPLQTSIDARNIVNVRSFYLFIFTLYLALM